MASGGFVLKCKKLGTQAQVSVHENKVKIHILTNTESAIWTALHNMHETTLLALKKHFAMLFWVSSPQPENDSPQYAVC